MNLSKIFIRLKNHKDVVANYRDPHWDNHYTVTLSFKEGIFKMNAHQSDGEEMMMHIEDTSYECGDFNDFMHFVQEKFPGIEV
jgi:hypothetical protein